MQTTDQTLPRDSSVHHSAVELNKHDNGITPGYTRRVITVKMPTGEDAASLNLFLPSHFDISAETDGVTLYTGPIIVHIGTEDIQGEGEVRLGFTPKLALTFHVRSKEITWPLIMSDDRNVPTTLEMVTTRRILSVSITSCNNSGMRGRITSPCSFVTLKSNGSPESIGRVRFHLLNFRAYIGERLFAPTPVSEGMWTGRTRTQFGPWELILDALPDLEERNQQLEEAVK